MKTLWALPAGVWLLGVVSLLNDVASEAIYPLLPFFLTTVLGATAVSLGVIEGAAEAVSSVLKIISGRLSDRWRRRKPIVIFGYSLSAAARPFISIAGSWGSVFALRFIDRVGKGNTRRAARRDARRFRRSHQSREGVRLSPRDGSQRRGDWTVAGHRISPRFSRSLSDIVCVDGDTRRSRRSCCSCG